MTTYFIADTHFGHTRVLAYCDRPFRSVKEMDDALFENWAMTVRPSDTVYHLGDVAFGERSVVLAYVEKIRKLPGKKYLVPGNHDYRYPGLLSDAFFAVLPPIFETSIQVQNGRSRRVVLSHYPMLLWNGLYHETVQLYGHVHGRIPGNSLQTDVGVDVWGYAPARAENVFARLATLAPFKNPEMRS